MSVAKATVGVFDRRVLRKVPFSSFHGPFSLDTPDVVFLLFSTFERQLGIAEMPKTRDFAIFVMTTTTTTELITLLPCTCACGIYVAFKQIAANFSFRKQKPY